MLREKTVAIVGNGPSGNNRGDVIDSMDFVVRVNMWRRTGPVNSGEKISAIAGYRRRTVDLPPTIDSNGSFGVIFQRKRLEKDRYWNWIGLERCLPVEYLDS